MWFGVASAVTLAGLVALGVTVGSKSDTDAAKAYATSGTSAESVPMFSLPSALIALPTGATVGVPPAGGRDGSLTLDEFLKVLYPTAPTERGLMQRRGFVSGATRWFRTSDGKIVAVYLIGFKTDAGAESYGLSLSAGHRDDHPQDPSFTVSGLRDGTGFEESELDADGYTRSFVYGSLGSETVLVHYFVPATLDRAGLLSIVDAQIAKLQKALTF
ncbi:MAG: hypothetical protein ACRDVE_09570 [Actinocrinis sp.]